MNSVRRFDELMGAPPILRTNYDTIMVADEQQVPDVFGVCVGRDAVRTGAPMRGCRRIVSVPRARFAFPMTAAVARTACEALDRLCGSRVRERRYPTFTRPDPLDAVRRI